MCKSWDAVWSEAYDIAYATAKSQGCSSDEAHVFAASEATKAAEDAVPFVPPPLEPGGNQ